jgi:ectoine hydroxylase-related dioxygenase (phytanoyl-CoA dioxygenase family)
MVEERIGPMAFPVRGIFFDKRSGANWGVPWHQDLAIAVAQRIETPGFGPWSIKEGVVHVQPPREVLEGMLVVRLHLDDCDAENGALRLIPGSHLQGELGTEETRDWCRRVEPTVCEVSKGGALLMRPLILHASSAATKVAHRRVLHVEYAVGELPNGLRWFERS